jgi:hypothetical protein
MFQYLFNDIKKNSNWWVLTLQSCFEDLRVYLGFQFPKWKFTWECEGSCPHTFCTLGSMWCDSQASLARNLASPCLGGWEELKVVKGNGCSCFRPTWKLWSRVMAPKVLQTTSWVFMRSLPWAQCKRWIPIGSLGCVHTLGEACNWRMC